MGSRRPDVSPVVLRGCRAFPAGRKNAPNAGPRIGALGGFVVAGYQNKKPHQMLIKVFSLVGPNFYVDDYVTNFVNSIIAYLIIQ